VKLLDGTGFSMPDTAGNQARFPQSSSQAPGVGFPLAPLCALIDLSSGALLEAATGPHRGRGHSELDLSRTLLPSLCRDDLLLADALYANYFMVAQLIDAGVDVLFEQHGSRHTDFRCGERLAVRDHLVPWHRPRSRPGWMTPEQYAAALGLDVLRCRTPAMIEKELWVYLLAYNLIRLLMAEAAAAELRTCRAALGRLEQLRLWSEDQSRSATPLRYERRGARRTSTRTLRTTSTKAATEILPLAEGAARRRARTKPCSSRGAPR